MSSKYTKQIFADLIHKFSVHRAGNCSLENARDQLQQSLNSRNPTEFRIGEYASLDSVIHILFQMKNPVWVGRHKCPNQHEQPSHVTQPRNLRNCLLHVDNEFTGSAQFYVNNCDIYLSTKCARCNSRLKLHFKCHQKPPILILEVASSGPVLPDRMLQFNVQGERCQYQLCAIAYFGGEHFVCRLISPDGHVWFHDGITSGTSTVYQGLVNDCDLSVCGTKTPSTYFYYLL